MTGHHPTGGARPVAFFVLLTALSLPFFVLGAVTDGVRIGAVQLPASALMFVLPAMTAGLLTARDDGVAGVVRLVRRGFDWSAAPRKIWYLIAAVLAPVIAVLTFIVVRAFGVVDSQLPLSLPAVPLVVVGALVAAEFEEIGWTGYATEPLQRRWQMIPAALMLGTFWAAWHVIPLVQVGRGVWWVTGWFLGTVAARVLIVWLHTNTGRGVLAAVVMHAALNVSAAATPGYDQAASTIVAGVMTSAVAIGVLLWGDRRLRRIPLRSPRTA